MKHGQAWTAQNLLYVVNNLRFIIRRFIITNSVHTDGNLVQYNSGWLGCAVGHQLEKPFLHLRDLQMEKKAYSGKWNSFLARYRKRPRTAFVQVHYLVVHQCPPYFLNTVLTSLGDVLDNLIRGDMLTLWAPCEGDKTTGTSLMHSKGTRVVGWAHHNWKHLVFL